MKSLSRKLLVPFLVLVFTGCTNVKQEFLNDEIYSRKHVVNLQMEYCRFAFYIHNTSKSLNDSKVCDKKNKKAIASMLSNVSPMAFDNCGYVSGMETLLYDRGIMNDLMIKKIDSYDEKIVDAEMIFNSLIVINQKYCQNNIPVSYDWE